MSDSGYYIGACPDCNTTLNHVHAEGNDLGYSGSNSGGHLLVENSEFNNNEEGFATQSQNNDDAPSPQDGSCPGGTNASPPPGAQRNDICWVLINNRIVNNNNGGSPTDPGAPGLVGTGMTIAGGRNDLVDGQHILGQRGVGRAARPLSRASVNSRRNRFTAEDNCKGGIKAEPKARTECVFESFANEISATRSRTMAATTTRRTVTSAKSPTQCRRS